jgi:oxygen-independent coproporphyrinogen-3 oxidase
MESLYIHVPFCTRKCGYCDFFSVEYDEDLVERYLDALEKEMQFYSEKLCTLQTVYIGGGTPSVLSEDGLERLLNAVSRNIRVNDGYEFTIEANPLTLSGKKIDIMNNYLINRVSLGVQSFNDKMLAALGRAHNEKEAEDALRLVTRNFDNFSIDLIYGIPAQDITVWEYTLKRAVSYDPPHISSYELTPEAGTPLYSGITANKVIMPEEESILSMYETATRILSDSGFNHYEISNYALRGFESAHNLNYWRRGEYIGLGPAAHSFLNGKRYKNVVNITDYCQKLDSGIAPFEEVADLSHADEIKETIFLGLRIAEGIDLGKIVEKVKHVIDPGIEYDKVVAGLRQYIDKELLRIGNDRLSITEKGYALSSTLIVEIMRTLGL